MSIELQPQSIPATHPLLSYFAATPNTKPLARLAILHGYGDHAGRYSHFMQWLAGHGIASFAVDFRGHGRSAGKPGFIHRWDDYLADLAAFLAIDPLSTENDSTPLFVLAHSHGGLVAINAAYAGMLNHCRGVILSAPYLDLKMPIPRLKRFFGRIMAVLYPSMPIRSGIIGSMLTRDPAMIAQSKADPYCRGIATPGWFFQTLNNQSKTRTLANQFNLPLMMLIPGQDSVANPQASVEFFEACSSTDKTMLHYPEHHHELLRELGREEIFKQIANWIDTRVSPKIPFSPA